MICSFRKVRRVNICGLLSVTEEPEAKMCHITTPPQSIHSRLSPHPTLCKREQKSMVSKRLHIKLLNMLLTGALKLVPLYRLVGEMMDNYSLLRYQTAFEYYVQSYYWHCCCNIKKKKKQPFSQGLRI